nr:carbon-nitrogen family hydrolase [Sedimentibacter sp.]
MKVSVVQMDMLLADPEYNFKHAEELIREAAKDKPDVITLPETWNTGFFPKENLEILSDNNGEKVKSVFGSLAKELNVNIVAGSVANLKKGKIYNTSFTFNRYGECVAEYDKTHLFTNMGEEKYFEWGKDVVTFEIDGVKCGIVICYDIRFLELVRTLSLQGIEVLFVVSQWPDRRLKHWQILNMARAIENQMFVVCTNSCGKAGETKYAGHSAIIDPLGEIIAECDNSEVILKGEINLDILNNIRSTINVYRDRNPELYKIN